MSMERRTCRACWKKCLAAVRLDAKQSIGRGVCPMGFPEPFRVGFVVKRYPRYSETFIVREILAHEEAGLNVEIFSLRPPNDGHFQELIGRVRARANFLYTPVGGLLPERLPGTTLTASHFWGTLRQAGEVLPGLWAALGGVGPVGA